MYWLWLFLKGVMPPWDASDTRRARHLTVWNSAGYVTKLVNGNTAAAPASAFALGVTAGLAGIGHRLGHSTE